MKRAVQACGICLAGGVVGILFSIMNTTLSSIQKDLTGTMVELQWVINILGLSAAFLVISGKLADIYGRRRLLLIGLILFILGMIGEALAPTLSWIIFCQAVIGFANAILLPVSQSLMTTIYPPEEKSKAIAIWTLTTGIALSIGPLLGGLITYFWDWRAIFWINGFLALMAFAIVRTAVPESFERRKSKPLNPLGAILLTLGLAALLLAIIQGPNWGWATGKVIALFFVALCMITSFIITELKTKLPMIELHFFANKQYVLSTLANSALLFLFWPFFFLLPLFLQNVMGYSSLASGSIFVLLPLPLLILSRFIQRKYVQWGPKPLLVLGFFFVLISIGVQLTFDISSSLKMVCLGILLAGIAFSFAWGPSITAGISAIPHKKSGMASGAFLTLQEVAGVIGLAITGALFRMQDEAHLLSGLHEKGRVFTEVQMSQARALLSDPEKLKNFFEQFKKLDATEFSALFKNAFTSGFHEALWLLFGIALLGLIVSFFFPNSSQIR